jgi:RHS repeat-associated protein
VGWTRKNGTNPNGGGQTKTMVFVSAGMQEVAEYEQGTLKRIYVYGSYIDEPLMMMPVGGGPVKKYYYHANNLYNVAAITDKNGVVVERYNYSPYGEATILDPTGLIQQPASSIQNPLLFTGRRLDAETGLMYYRARYYDTQLGRFVGRDPLEYVDGLSMYEYVGNSPIIHTDPTGNKIFVVNDEGMPLRDYMGKPSYNLQPKGASPEYLRAVINAFQSVGSGCITIIATSYHHYWEISYRDTPASKTDSKCCQECVKKLKNAIDKEEKMYIYDAKDNYNAYHQPLPSAYQQNTANVIPYPMTQEEVFFKMSEKGEFINGKMAPDFAATLWHEVIAHASMGLSHPNPSENSQNNWNKVDDHNDLRSDPAIAVENEYRKCVGLPLRWRHYY